MDFIHPFWYNFEKSILCLVIDAFKRTILFVFVLFIKTNIDPFFTSYFKPRLSQINYSNKFHLLDSYLNPFVININGKRWI